jgi:DNA replication protein DnaC
LSKQGLVELYAKQLKLSSFANYQEVIRQAKSNGMNYEEFLLELMSRELARRKDNQLKRRIKKARFPLMKSLDNFQFENLPHVKEALIWELASGDFIQKKENIVMVGPPGTGKTHLAIALGLKACSNGYSVRFFTAAGLVNELTEAQDEKRLVRLETQLAKVNLLIVDELSYVSFPRYSAELLFQVLSERTERSSVIITTNLDFSRWVEVFGDAMLATAIVDRLIYRSHVLNMNAESYRFKQSKKAKA